VIDLGPEAGIAGGDLVAEGTPEEIALNPRSHTGKFLKPVLAASPLGTLGAFPLEPAPAGKANQRQKVAGKGVERASSAGKPGSPENNGSGGAKKKKAGDSTGRGSSEPANRVARVDGEVKAPWETDGRKWHTRDRVARNGRPARWDGRILERTVDRIEELGQSETGLAPADWSQRGIVRINSVDKTKIAFPFLHATTSSEWVVILRFFVPKNTFSGGDLEARLKLVPFHQSETPVLCDLPRLKFTNLGPFHEITIVGHSAQDFETPAFDAFLKKGVKAFLGMGAIGKLTKASELE
jgi:excinuclease ABC subunit A